MPGGTRHYNFARELIKRGHEVCLIAANYNHFSHQFIATPAAFGEIDAQFDVPFVWIPTPAYEGNTIKRLHNMVSFSLRLLRKKYLSKNNPPDVIIGSSPHLFAALSGELLARHFNIPFVLEVRDLWPAVLVDLGVSRYHPMIKLMQWIEKYLYRRATHIITLLPGASAYLEKFSVPAQKITWLPNSVQLDVIPQYKQKSDTDKFTIMYAGTHGLANDLETILKAANILQQKKCAHTIRIRLIGDGPEKPRLKSLALRLNLSTVEFCDPVSKKEIYSVLNEADVFVILLTDSPVFRWGISPNKLFDYLAMERPIIFGINSPFNPIEKFKAGISIKPGDPAALADAILQLFLLPQNELDAMGKRGGEFVRKYHHLSHLTDSLEALLKNVTNTSDISMQVSKASDF
jgi:glycosyltransferase involved in cell wall biosynthesis